MPGESDEIKRFNHGFSKKIDSAVDKADTQKLHKQRHVLLHNELDELLADFLWSTGKRPSQTTIFELLQWSCAQSQKPDPLPKTGSFGDR
jgi:hypothetical protein